MVADDITKPVVFKFVNAVGDKWHGWGGPMGTGEHVMGAGERGVGTGECVVGTGDM